MSNIQNVLTPNEKILWEDKPQFLPFILSTLPALIIGFIFGALAVIPAALGAPIDIFMQLGGYGALVFFLGVGTFVYGLFNYQFIHYVITDKRTLIQQGVIGRDYVGIEHDQVVSTSVSVGLADKLFGKNSGSVMVIHSGSSRGKNGAPRPSGLKSITDPYKVYQLLNKVSHDIRTDIQYPNAMRPDTNTGYGTQYKA